MGGDGGLVGAAVRRAMTEIPDILPSWPTRPVRPNESDKEQRQPPRTPRRKKPVEPRRDDGEPPHVDEYV